MTQSLYAQAELRHPDDVMRLSRMGAMFPSRLSFLRSLTRQLIADESQVSRMHWDMNSDGFGTAVYTLTLGGHSYSLFAISQALDADMRTDRVIAEAWDAAFVLYDGVPDASEIARLSQSAPLQEAGRFTCKDLCLSRANKSVRLFDQIVTALPNRTALPTGMIPATGYLIRTTSVSCTGQFWLRHRRRL